MNSLWQILATILSVAGAFSLSPGTTEDISIKNGRMLKILQREYPDLFYPDFDMVKRYSSYAFGLGKRKPKFSFGIGKRDEDMENVLSSPMYGEKEHLRERRSATGTEMTDSYEMEQPEIDQVKRGSYGFGIGKRYNNDVSPELYPLIRQNFMNYLANGYLLSRIPYYKAMSVPIRSDNMGDKRAKMPYSFGLGKRAYSFGLGKRAYSFGLGKRQSNELNFKDENYDSVNKRQSNYHFGLGKRAYDFGLGKKNRDSN